MLIDQIKPEILVSLNKDYEKYNTSINYIYNVFILGLWYTGVLLKMLPDITKNPEGLAVMDFQPNVEFIIPNKNEKL